VKTFNPAGERGTGADGPALVPLERRPPFVPADLDAAESSGRGLMTSRSGGDVRKSFKAKRRCVDTLRRTGADFA